MPAAASGLLALNLEQIQLGGISTVDKKHLGDDDYGGGATPLPSARQLKRPDTDDEGIIKTVLFFKLESERKG